MSIQKHNAGHKPAYKKHQVVSAQPGYDLIDWVFFDSSKGIDVSREPIQAWVISIYETKDGVHTVVEPATHEKRSSFYEGAILYPDGRVVIAGVDEWRSLEDYVAHINKNYSSNTAEFCNKQEELHLKECENSEGREVAHAKSTSR